MARFKITNPELKTIPTGKQNAGQKYLSASLVNLNDPWSERDQKYTVFNQRIVAVFEKILPVAKGGLAQQEQAIPTELVEITGCFVDWQAPKPFYKMHLSDHPAQPATPTRAARPAIKAGQLVGTEHGGIPTTFTTLRVFCRYYLDENGEKQWGDGQSPNEVGQQAFRNYCVNIAENTVPQRVDQEKEIVGGVDYTNQQPQPQGQFPFNPQGPVPPTM